MSTQARLAERNPHDQIMPLDEARYSTWYRSWGDISLMFGFFFAGMSLNSLICSASKSFISLTFIFRHCHCHGSRWIFSFHGWETSCQLPPEMHRYSIVLSGYCIRSTSNRLTSDYVFPMSMENLPNQVLASRNNRRNIADAIESFCLMKAVCL